MFGFTSIRAISAEVVWHATEFGAFWVDCNDNFHDDNDDDDDVAKADSFSETHEEGEVDFEAELEPETQIRLTRRTALALVIENEHFCVYHCMANSRDIREENNATCLKLDIKVGLVHFFSACSLLVSSNGTEIN